MRLIDRHLLTATAGPFLFGWFVITFLLMIDVLFRYVDLFVSKGESPERLLCAISSLL